MLNETDLIAGLRNGDPAAWGIIVNEYSDGLIKYGLNLNCDLTDLQDALGDTLTQLWETRATIDSIRNIRAYLFIVYRNTLFKQLRTNQKQAIDHLSEELYKLIRDESNTDFEELHKAVRIAFASLSEQEQQVLVLNVVKGIKAPRIAKALGISAASVHTTKSSAIKKMKIALKDKVKWRRKPPTALIIVLVKLIIVKYQHF